VKGSGLNGATRRAGRLVCTIVCLAAGACAPKTLPPPPVVTTPKFPEYVFPALPDGLAGPGIASQYRSGWDYLQAGDTHGADRTFSAVLKAMPSLYPAEAALGYSALARKDAQGAMTHFDRALTANGSYAPALAGKGEALLSVGRADSALQAFEAALAADPELPALRSRVDVLRFRDVQQEIAAARRAAEAGRTEDARKAYQSAITASPESAFLYRELAAVDRRAGDLTAALEHAQRAAALDPGDARALALIGEIHESNHEWAQAADAYMAAAALEPGDAMAAKADAMREHLAFEAMPDEYRSIEAAPTITRAQLAALVGVRLDDLLRRSRSANAVVITDARDNWAAPWIQAVTRAGVMDVLPNHTFQPSMIVRRADLAEAVSGVLSLITTENPKAATRWSDARPKFSDVSPGHLNYPAAARSVSSGVMAPLEGGSFQLARPVTGEEAVAAVSRLQTLVKSSSK
jgi:tetratricopeptide (TPR) repeat protein